MAKDDKPVILTIYYFIFLIMINGENLVKEITTLQMKFEIVVKEIRELQEKDKDNNRWLTKLNYANRNDGESSKINDRVRIVNAILHPLTNDKDDTARNATVIKVKIDKKGNTLVYIETDNGYKTHRIPYHLKKISA